ncbi:DUF2326 domain-containing protein [Flavobacterium limnophilum]|uniref:DUF2326 domain-containing protein n=1 Tax=Flavobacterium limnophilum TaxID=3003262 RepID=UPI002482911C|nr:DUF2326 domain-containing protein [Flavobacterium limnophilum]
MKLIELGANKPTFRTIYFNPSGITLIIGKRAEEKGNNTYNGVGKSFALYLVQFCLASKSNLKLSKKLPTWEFYLKFSIEGKDFIVKRSTDNQSKVSLNGEEKSLSEFSEFMLMSIFTIPDGVTKASFRSLISRFLRTRKQEYFKFDNFVYKEQDERALLSNSILLGLNSLLVEKKFLLKEEINKISDFRKAIQSDETFNSFFGADNDIDIVIKELEESIQKLEIKISQFEIAEDYSKIEEQSNLLSYQLKESNNQLSLLRETLKNIIKSLHLRSDMSESIFDSFIASLESELNIKVSERVSEVKAFHQNLTTGRTHRLNKEKTNILEQIDEEEKKQKLIASKYDTSLKFLNKYGALDDYVSVNQKLNEDKNALSKITTSIQLINAYKKRESEIKLVMAEDNLATEQYLQVEKQGHLAILMDSYRALTGSFYDDKKGGISVVNNDGQNKLRYKIDVRIQDDASDGINEVRIFCFDLLLLLSQINHNVKFIFHDSRLFANMDTHQRFSALNIASEIGSKDFQYIASMNQDTLDILKEERSAEEYKEIIEENIVLELNGDNPEGRLLGIHLDLDYLE